MPTVLVVDDVPLMRDTLCRVLRREGYDAVAAGDGLEAIGALEAMGAAGTVAPDLILLDMNLPNMTGLEVLEQLRQHPRWQRVPVVVLSGFADPRTQARAAELGAKEFVVKADFTIPEMLDRVKLHTAYRPN